MNDTRCVRVVLTVYEAGKDVTKLAIAVAKQAAEVAGHKVQAVVEAWAEERASHLFEPTWRDTMTNTAKHAVMGNFFSISKEITVTPSFSVQ